MARMTIVGDCIGETSAVGYLANWNQASPGFALDTGKDVPDWDTPPKV